MREFPVAYRTDDSYGVDDEAYDADEEEPGRGLLSWILIVALLMGTGSGSALLWRTFAGGPIIASPTSTASAEKPPGQGDVETLRQQITGSVQSTQQLRAAQQAEIKRLSDQVAALSGKLELLQRPVTSAQAAMSAVAAPKTVAVAPKKKADVAKPVAAKPGELKPTTTGAISTGRALLQSSR
jgi:hypothetical protein